MDYLQGVCDKLNENIEGLINIEVNIDRCNKNGKHGVAECEIEEIQNLLKPYISSDKTRKNAIKISDLYKINVFGTNQNKELYNEIITRYHLGNSNNKKLVKKLNMLNLKLEDLYDH